MGEKKVVDAIGGENCTPSKRLWRTRGKKILIIYLEGGDRGLEV